MARSVLVITDSYQLASGTAAIFTIKKIGAGTLFLNDVNTDDDAAEAVSKGTPGIKGLQFEQSLIKNTYIRASVASAGWEIVIEEG